MRKGGGSLNSLVVGANIFRTLTVACLPSPSFLVRGNTVLQAKHDIVSKMKSSPRHLHLCDGLTSHRLEC